MFYEGVWVAVGTVLQYAYAASAGVVVAGVSSKHLPNHPLLVHVVVVASVVELSSVVVLSLQPNQPGVSQVLVDVVVNSVVVASDVVVSSRHPHQPGVLQVSVLVRVVLDVVLVVDGLVCVPFSNFHK